MHSALISQFTCTNHALNECILQVKDTVMHILTHFKCRSWPSQLLFMLSLGPNCVIMILILLQFELHPSNEYRWIFETSKEQKNNRKWEEEFILTNIDRWTRHTSLIKNSTIQKCYNSYLVSLKSDNLIIWKYISNVFSIYCKLRGNNICTYFGMNFTLFTN